MRAAAKRIERLEQLEQRENDILDKVFAQMTDEELESIVNADEWESIKPVHTRYLQLRAMVEKEMQNAGRGNCRVLLTP